MINEKATQVHVTQVHMIAVHREERTARACSLCDRGGRPLVCARADRLSTSAPVLAFDVALCSDCLERLSRVARGEM